MPEGRTKIIATIGPALDADGVLERLLDTGVDVLRVNLSHAGPREQAARVRRARAHRPDIAVLADLAGPKLRLGDLPRGAGRQGRGRPSRWARAGCRSAIRRCTSGCTPAIRSTSPTEPSIWWHRGRRRSRRLPGPRRRDAALAQGHQPAARHLVASGADRKGPRRSGRPRRPRARLHRHLLRPPRARHRRGAHADQAAARRQDREAAGAGAPGRHPRRHRRHHGGARRSGGGDPDRAGARPRRSG